MDEKKEIDRIKKEFNDTFKEILQIIKLKNDNNALYSLEKYIQNIPEEEILIKNMKELKSNSLDNINSLKKQRNELFFSYISKFISDARENDIFVQQTSDGWRVGYFEYRIKNDISKISVLYNKAEIIPWTAIRSVNDIEKLRSKALSLLKKYEINFSDLMPAIEYGYQEAERKKKQTNLTSDSPINILEFLREFRLALFRNQLGKKIGKKLKYADLPEWALLYNIDRYRMNMDKMPSKKRYVLSVPSQKTQSEGKSILLGGLDPKRGYEYFSSIKVMNG